MNKYEITFMPLAKAPKGTFAVVYTIDAVSEAVAKQMAAVDLLRDSLSRSNYKAKLEVKVISDLAVDSTAESSVVTKISDLKVASTAVVPGTVDNADPVKVKFDFDLAALNVKIEALLPGEMLILDDLDNELYHASEGVSCSKLKLFRQCPAKYKAQYIDKIMPEVSKDTFNLGTAIHTITLEPHLFDSTVIRMPAEIKQRRGIKWEEFKAKYPGQIILPGANYDLCEMANQSISNHTFARRMVTGGRPEVSVFKRDEQTGFIIKCRPDYWLDDLVVDVKTAASAEPKKFGMDAKKFGYHMQDSMYRDITGAPEFAFLVIENKAPCIVTAPVLMSPEARRLGYLQYRDALVRLKIAIETDTWENYTNEPVVVELTSWENQELETLENSGVAA